MTNLDKRLKQIMHGKLPKQSEPIEPESRIPKPIKNFVKGIDLIFVPSSIYRAMRSEVKKHEIDRGALYSAAILDEAIRIAGYIGFAYMFSK